MTKATYSSEKALNREQREAVEFGEGPLLIIAGAGTGKTTVITERIKHLISAGHANASQILALTFTEKAARQMQERVDVAMPYGYTQMWISTFHSFCDRILRSEAIHIGLDPGYRLLTDADATMLVRKHLFSFSLEYFRPLGNPTKFIEGMLHHFSRLKDEDVTPGQYERWVKSQITNAKSQTKEEKEEVKKYKELSNAYIQYERLKEKEGMMDFSDLIANTLRLFRTRAHILQEYQDKFSYILVDEFQDTNVAQNELILLLAQKTRNLTAVADDDQSIYKFRGAAVSNVISFRKYFSDARVVVLSRNYRSTQTILDHSYRLIVHNNPDRLEVKEKINKKLVSDRTYAGKPVSFIHTDRVENEAEEVAKEIKHLAEKGRLWRDVAILVRANNHAEPFARALSRYGIPYQFLGPGQLFRQAEIKDLIAYLQFLENIDDNVALFRVLSNPFLGFSPRFLAGLSAKAKKQNMTFFEVVEKEPEMEKFTGMVHRHLGHMTKETAGQILYYFLEDTGILKRIVDISAPMDERKAANISKFFNKLKTYEVDHEDASVAAVLDWILLSLEMGESPLAGDVDWVENDAVNMLTVHSAKGLEFPVVFLVNLVSERFPTRQRREQIPIPDALIKEELPQGDFHMQEERRLFYVGLTRAKDLLYLTAADYYGEGKREKQLSPFIAETLGAEAIHKRAELSSSQMSLLEWKKFPEPVTTPAALTLSYISYSQIETFRMCPLHYKLRYILGIPTPPSASLSFGTSVHAALREFYDSVKKKEPVTGKTLFELLDTHWVSQGYGSKTYEEEMKRRGIRYLTLYLEKEFSPKTDVIALEQPFTVPIVVGNRRIKIGGKIDRVDKLSDESIEIIDYKTGRIPSKRELDTNLQLSMYAIAASEIAAEPFGRKAENVKLTLYFLDAQDKDRETYRVTSVRTREQLEGQKEEIINIVRQIESSDFACSGNMLCKRCEYQLFCDAA